MNEELVVVQGKVFDVIGVNELVIAELNKQYLPLKINGIDDKEGYKAAHEGLMKYVKARTMVEKHGKATREKAVKYQKDVIAEEKRVIGLLAPGEEHLRAERQAIDDIGLAIKAEAEAKEAARIQKRVDVICAFGATFNGQMYEAYGLQIPMALVRAYTDEEFAQFVAQVQEKRDAEAARIKAEEEARKAEVERIAKIAAEQEAERVRLAEISRKQEEEAARINAEKEAMEKVKDAKRRAEELEKAKKEAAEKALRDAEEKRKRDEKARIERDRKAKEAAEKKAARRPDKAKILAYIDALVGVEYPQFKTDEASTIFVEIQNVLQKATGEMREKAEAL